MKKVLSLALSLCLMCSAAGAEILTIDTETASESELTTMIDTLDKVRQEKIVERLSATPIQPTDEDTYTFKGAPWYCTKSQAEKIWKQKSNYDYSSIRTVDILEYPNFDSKVAGESGIDVRYGMTSVAGYSARMIAEFVYPIEDGIIIRDNDSAQLYMAYYWISNDDYTDISGIYNDLESKLTSIYGTPDDASDKYHLKKEWSDKSGNRILLTVNTSMYNITIGYLVSDAEERVEAMKEAIDNEAIRQEQLDRLNNSNNVDGL